MQSDSTDSQITVLTNRITIETQNKQTEAMLNERYSTLEEEKIMNELLVIDNQLNTLIT